MAVFTNVPDDVLEPGDPIRSVDILAIKENAVFVGQFVNQQTFNSNGTWTKPLQDGVEIGQMARIQVWAGGGGGARNTGTSAAIGGGGGGYNEITVPLSTLASTVTVTIGSGGAGRTGSTGEGTAGGTTTFGTLIGAAGGQGGSLAGQVFGGGPLSSDLSLDVFIGIGNPLRGGFGRANGLVTSASVYGGAGGAGASTSAFDASLCKSFLGGFGGAGSRTTTAPSGAAPAGGGGGANNNQNGGDGAAGRVVVTVW